MRWSRRQVVQGAGVVGLGLLAGCGRLPWQAQPRIPRVGFLASASPPSPSPSSYPAYRLFLEGLEEHGYVEGQNIVVEWRFSEGQAEKPRLFADELVRLPVDVLVAAGQIHITAAKQMTDSIPIVMSGIDDPVGSGLVASLARPGGHITGVSLYSVQLGEKRLELLKEVLPAVARVAVLGDSTTLREYETDKVAAAALGIDLQFLEVRAPEELAMVSEAATKVRAEAIVVHLTVVTVPHLPRIAELARAQRLPAMSELASFPQAGGLMSYGPSSSWRWRRTAYYVDRILKGASPADLPVEQPTTFDFVINVKTAQTLGLTIPPHILLQATEVIQ
jgi:putative tryptophan/tyrosine transport system substrate-binding protein